MLQGYTANISASEGNEIDPLAILRKRAYRRKYQKDYERRHPVESSRIKRKWVLKQEVLKDLLEEGFLLRKDCSI